MKNKKIITIIGVTAFMTIPAIICHWPAQITMTLAAVVITYLVLALIQKEPDVQELLNLIGECRAAEDVERYRYKMLEQIREFLRKKDTLTKILTLDYQEESISGVDEAFQMAEKIIQSKAGRFYKRLLIIKSRNKTNNADMNYLYKILQDTQRVLNDIDGFLVAVSEMKQDHSLNENKIVDFTNALILLNQEEMRYE